MDPTKEETYTFISNFLSEMATLFPDPYFHVGGDQVNGKQWQENPDICNFMASQGIKDVRDLHSYFNRRLHTILQKLGKGMVGWDPILHPDLPKNAIIQSVRGQKWLAEAVKMGFQGIAGSEYYLDELHPASYHYGNDPLDGEVEELTKQQQDLILGGEASMWTEFADKQNIDSRIWPRAAAIAERLWSARDVKNPEDMYASLSVMGQRLDWVGMSHESGPQQILRRLVDYGSVDALRTLADIVQPSFIIRWKNHDYTSTTPLNRLVDASAPDSEAARWFSRMVEQFLAEPSDVLRYNALNSRLKVWRNNHVELDQVIQTSSLLAEVGPLSKLLEQVADIGLKLLTVLSTGQAMEHSKWKEQELVLKQANDPIAELVLIITPDIQKLHQAVLNENIIE